MPMNTEHITIAPHLRDILMETWPDSELFEVSPDTQVVESYIGEDAMGEDRWFSALIEPMSEWEPGVRVTFMVTASPRSENLDAEQLGGELNYVGPSEPGLSLVTRALVTSVLDFGRL